MTIFWLVTFATSLFYLALATWVVIDPEARFIIRLIQRVWRRPLTPNRTVWSIVGFGIAPTVLLILIGALTPGMDGLTMAIAVTLLSASCTTGMICGGLIRLIRRRYRKLVASTTHKRQ